ncbi:2'-hydroxyisoflavone reductase [Deinobacterium chartae]|uniref:2'-hydroxyisoflavone reductase n=1 Tax=Deinobacterium chartae TaxID=521158 RepID=A0A841HW34_9DEIO|nr:NAD-dependent epimerase/dehydratase family protein [Deinobacterium chartae]MBB6096874.1 2'-hydroxyisoflavone reductase [Deinobacterium chartae]
MDILVLGGGQFVGRHIVEAALANGHRVATFNRGRTGSQLFPEVERILGDRTGDLSALENRRFDAVIDVSGYVPRFVRNSAQLLRDRSDFYLFISTISVYAPGTDAPDEDSPVGTLEDETVEEVTGATYGPLKALCEQEVRAAFGERCAVVRPGLVAGPFDPTDRFTYWPHRVDLGGEVLAPGRPGGRFQYVDVRDLAAFALHLVEKQHDGTFNAVRPPELWGDLLEAARLASGAEARFIWADEAFLAEQGVRPWVDLPMWIPEGPDAGLTRVSSARALAAGMPVRPLGETVLDTLNWDRSRGAEEFRWALSPEREREVLDAWTARHG